MYASDVHSVNTKELFKYSELPNTSVGTYTSVGWHILKRFIMCRPEHKCRVAHCLKINTSAWQKNVQGNLFFSKFKDFDQTDNCNRIWSQNWYSAGPNKVRLGWQKCKLNKHAYTFIWQSEVCRWGIIYYPDFYRLLLNEYPRPCNPGGGWT